MSDQKNPAKSGEKNPALIVFGRIRGSNVDQAAVFLKMDADAARKAAIEAGLLFIEVKIEAEQKAAATLPEGVIANGRFSLSPASTQIIGELERLLQSAKGQAAIKQDTASDPFSADLWRRLQPGALVLAATFDEEENLSGWWEAIIVSVDDDEFLVRWRDFPNEPRVSRGGHYVALLHPGLAQL